jgi:hypothetical protein
MSAASFLQDLKKHTITLLGWVIGLGVLAVIAWWLLPDDWQIKYAWQYSVDSDQVVVERKPHKCDWDSAPLGNKHCHYKPIVTLYDSVGVVIRTDNVTPTKIHVGWEQVEE